LEHSADGCRSPQRTDPEASAFSPFLSWRHAVAIPSSPPGTEVSRNAEWWTPSRKEYSAKGHQVNGFISDLLRMFDRTYRTEVPAIRRGNADKLKQRVLCRSIQSYGTRNAERSRRRFAWSGRTNLDVTGTLSS